ncbi:F-box/LRR-repeat protein 21-like [Physella acuta]|uniref:F-box/LRR-repeat protein 21-like n=1 Tax=Physella acuta TaxID=109671 RepID=UPI0027DE2E38|nr:F-box/LRR-repeat protein 21-like [Physella acuta]
MSEGANKRLKRVTVDLVDCEGNVGKRGLKFADQRLAPPDWSQLPYEILLQVFRYLNDNSDKYHAALTCKSWLRPLSEPSLWQSGDFVFNAKSRTRAVRFVRIAGQSLRHFRADYPEPKGLIYCNEEVYQFLANLINSRNQRLVTFKMTNLQYLDNCNVSDVKSTSIICNLLTNLLGQQHQLRVLDLSNSPMSFKQGLELLKAVTTNCSSTVHTLVLNKFFQSKLTCPTALSKFVNSVCSFKNLSDLELSYDHLCDDLLLNLAKNSPNLKVITLRADGDSSADKITCAAWQQLTAACPELQAVVSINKPKQAFFDQGPSEILTLSMPLYKVSWDAGLIAIQNIEQFFQRVSRDFQNTLHHIELKTGVRLDKICFELLFKSFQTCRHLDSVSVDVTCDRRSDQDDYMFVITDVMTRCPVSYDVILNGHKVNGSPSV